MFEGTRQTPLCGSTTKVVEDWQNTPLAACVWGWCGFVHFAFSHFPYFPPFFLPSPIPLLFSLFFIHCCRRSISGSEKNVTSCSGVVIGPPLGRGIRVEAWAVQIPRWQLAWFALGGPNRLPRATGARRYLSLCRVSSLLLRIHLSISTWKKKERYINVTSFWGWLKT